MHMKNSFIRITDAIDNERNSDHLRSLTRTPCRFSPGARYSRIERDIATLLNREQTACANALD